MDEGDFYFFFTCQLQLLFHELFVIGVYFSFSAQALVWSVI